MGRAATGVAGAEGSDRANGDGGANGTNGTDGVDGADGRSQAGRDGGVSVSGSSGDAADGHATDGGSADGGSADGGSGNGSTSGNGGAAGRWARREQLNRFGLHFPPLAALPRWMSAYVHRSHSVHGPALSLGVSGQVSAKGDRYGCRSCVEEGVPADRGAGTRGLPDLPAAAGAARPEPRPARGPPASPRRRMGSEAAQARNRGSVGGGLVVRARPPYCPWLEPQHRLSTPPKAPSACSPARPPATPASSVPASRLRRRQPMGPSRHAPHPRPAGTIIHSHPLRRELGRGLLARRSILSRVGASGKPGAVQLDAASHFL